MSDGSATFNQFAGALSADRFTVKRVLELARAGQLRIPPFQRPLRWRREDHRLLLDSLYRQYPVGTLLLWEKAAPEQTLVFGGFFVAAASGLAYWIVDGQQRVTSIVGCLLQPEQPGRRAMTDFSFLFDLEKEVFIDAAGQSAPHLVPVNQLRDPVQIGVWARTNRVSDAQHTKAQEACSRLLGYEIPTYVTKAESDAVLRTIFDRANTAGRPMRRVEVFEALNKGLHPEESPAGLTERLQQVLHALEFGVVESKHLQQALFCVAGSEAGGRLPEQLKEPGAASRWERPTADGLRMTVEFLRDAARIPHSYMLPYSLPLIVLPRFFNRFSNPRERSVELLVRWVWRGIARAAHAATNQNLVPHFRALGISDEESVVQEFLRLVGIVRPAELPESTAYNLRGMKTRLELAVMFARAPRHIQSGKLLSPVECFDDEAPDEPLLFPSDSGLEPQPRSSKVAATVHLPRVRAEDRALFRSVHARFLHPRVGTDDEFGRLLSKATDDVLDSQAIPASHRDAVRRGEWDEVVAARGETIRQEARSMVERFARWTEDGDIPSIESILGDSEDRAEASP